VSIQFIHGRIAMAMVLFAFLSAAYGLLEYFRQKPVSPNYWGIIVVGNLLALGQGALGAWMALNGASPARGWIHFVYGIVAVLWIPIIQFANNQLKPGHAAHQETLVTALVSLFEFFIALRAITTGG
jgi:hypothetical protein